MSLPVYRSILILLVLTSAFDVLAQRSSEDGTSGPLPKEVRGYKVNRARAEMKKTNEPDRKRKADKKSEKDKSAKDEYDEDEPLLIRLGAPQLVGVTPLGVSCDVPESVVAVEQ